MLYEPLDAVFQDVGDAEIVPPEWVIENMIPVGLTFYVGPPKSFKSAALFSLCLETVGVPTGVLPADLRVVRKKGLVLGLSAEASAGVLRHDAREGFGVEIPSDGRLRVCNDPWRFRLDSKTDQKELLAWCDEVKPSILFIDPLRNLHNVEENDAGAMVAVLQPFQHYAVKNKMAVVCIHHVTKLEEGSTAKASNMRGTSALLGLADGALAFTRKGGTDSTTVHIDALFKRAPAWERTIDLGIWGNRAQEKVDQTCKDTLRYLKEGVAQGEIAKKLGVGKSKVLAAVQQLRRLGVLNDAGQIVAELPASATERVNVANERVG
ncbi:MAG: AAA family ATPase [Solirubrobacterales bacterium]